MAAKPKTGWYPPIEALKRVLAMAEDMSHCTTYGELDDDGEYIGTHPDVLRDLATVRAWLGLPEKKP